MTINLSEQLTINSVDEADSAIMAARTYGCDLYVVFVPRGRDDGQVKECKMAVLRERLRALDQYVKRLERGETT